MLCIHVEGRMLGVGVQLYYAGLMSDAVPFWAVIT